MTSTDRPPLIGVPACVVQRDGFEYHQVGDKYVASVIDGAGGLPLVIPALGPRLDGDALLDEIDGLLITGSPSNVEPHHYGGPAPPPDSPRDPARDATTLPLIRRALARGGAAVRDLPRPAGAQRRARRHAASGGAPTARPRRSSLRQDRADRRSAMRRRIRCASCRAACCSACWTAPRPFRSTRCTARGSIVWRTVSRSRRSRPTARSRRSRSQDAPGFALAVQWHPEWRVLENPTSRRLFAAFGAACRARQRVRHERHGALAPGA